MVGAFVSDASAPVRVGPGNRMGLRSSSFDRHGLDDMLAIFEDCVAPGLVFEWPRTYLPVKDLADVSNSECPVQLLTSSRHSMVTSAGEVFLDGS